MSMKRPAFLFYPGDWIKEPKLSRCSPATRGVWIDLLCAMYEDDQSGKLVGTFKELAQMCRCDAEEMKVALRELLVTKTSQVTFSDGIVTVICRRMFREAKVRSDTKLRVKRHREKQIGNADVTIASSSSSSSSEDSATQTEAIEPSQNGKPQEPVSRRIWSDGVELLTASGMLEKTARSMLGKLGKEYGSGLLAECIAVTQAANAVEPESFLIGTLKNRRNKQKSSEQLPSVADMLKTQNLDGLKRPQ